MSALSPKKGDFDVRLLIDPGTSEWEQARIGKITASTAAACLGLSPHMSRQKAWRVITGREVIEQNSFMTYGRAMESRALAEYEVETGRLVLPGGFWVSDEYPWMLATPDGLVGAEGLAEAKCPGKLPVIVPIRYRIQTLVQMIVTGRKWCDFYAWVRGADGEPDQTFLRRCHLAGQDGLVARLEAFWRDYVLEDVEPPRKKPRRRKRVA